MSLKQRAALAVGSGLSGTAEVVDNEALSAALEVTGITSLSHTHTLDLINSLIT